MNDKPLFQTWLSKQKDRTDFVGSLAIDVEVNKIIPVEDTVSGWQAALRSDNYELDTYRRAAVYRAWEEYRRYVASPVNIQPSFFVWVTHRRSLYYGLARTMLKYGNDAVHTANTREAWLEFAAKHYRHACAVATDVVNNAWNEYEKEFPLT